MDAEKARGRLAVATGPLMVSDRFKYDAAAREDVLRLVAVGQLLGGRDTAGLSEAELEQKCREACGA